MALKVSRCPKRARRLPKNAAKLGGLWRRAAVKFDNARGPSDISVMTEITVSKTLPPAIERFVVLRVLRGGSLLTMTAIPDELKAA